MTVVRSTPAVRASTVARVHAASGPFDRLWTLAVAGGALATGVLAASMLVPATAHAAPVDRQLFTWSGRVDREVYITMRGRDVRTTGIDARLPNRSRVNEALPRGRGDVLVRLRDGRGDVRVVEQPSARNGYTTTIRITDPRGGADNYRVEAYWQGDDRFDDRNGGPWNDRDSRDRDGRWDRNDCGPNNNGRGGGWGRGGRKENCDYRPGRGNDNRDRDDRGRNDRGGWDDRGGRDSRDDRNGSGSLRWSGRVDDVVELRISGRRVDAITRSGRRVEDVNSNVQVIQQPSAWNNYTAVIRIYDPQGGASWYDLSAYWN